MRTILIVAMLAAATLALRLEDVPRVSVQRSFAEHEIRSLFTQFQARYGGSLIGGQRAPLCLSLTY